MGVDAIAYSSRTVSDLEKENLFHFTSYYARIQIWGFQSSVMWPFIIALKTRILDYSVAKTSKLTLRFKSGALIGSFFMVYKAFPLVKTKIYTSVLYQEGSITHTM